MDPHSSSVATRRREQETVTPALESAASSFGELVDIFARYPGRFGGTSDLSVARALRAAQRGLALCDQLLGRSASE